MRNLGIVVAATLVITACGGGKDDSRGGDYISAPHVMSARSTPGMERLIAAARAATARYHNVEAAVADGYIPDGFGCISEPGVGAMGEHYINLQIDADPAIDLTKPELLLYEPGKDGKLVLVGVEYEVFQADWYNAGNTEPPSLFGEEFEPMIFPGLDPLFGLHVWLWRHNPTGMIQSFNSAVSCP